ncbi:SpoIIE family protein phosphatase [Streptomyces oryzae]|uniref:SpoIIE family protein phosphatase n=1 Tax=Streptomyces oryzae TaxID=1434886 RepID=A0ABS3XK41_9ACTN|nr:SpoIIE family protein phosphatase/ATP-binding protein [Streptomyces oryzae]MBO8195441.1 SpoIIE family protein phosphatase [Streptomyces oryzae]
MSDEDHIRQRRARARRGRRPRSLLSVQSVAGQVLLLQLVLVVILVAATVAVLVLQARRTGIDATRDEVLSAGEAFANAPGTAEALDSPDPTAILQPRTEVARKRTGVDNIVVATTKGIRLTHRDPHQIGKHYVGPFRKAVRGKSFTHIVTDPLGLSVYAAVPVFRRDGSVAGIVSPEITVRNVNKEAGRQLPLLLGTAGGVLALAIGGSALVSRRLGRQTRGLGPVEMTRMYEHHDAVLHAVREGVLIVDDDGRLLLVNDEARRLLDLPRDAEQREITGLGLAPGITELLTQRRPVTDEVRMAGDRLLAVNVRPVDQPARATHIVATLRDTTELQALAGRAEVARERLQLLYEAGVRVGTTLDVERTAEELAEVAVPRFADFVTVELLEPVLRGEEAGEASTRMRRVAVRGVREGSPLYPAGELLPFAPSHPVATGVTTGRALLVPELAASQDWRAQDPEHARRLLDYGIHSLLSVPLQARGVVLGVADFWRADKEPFEESDLSFAQELTARAAVSIDNARRYTREHAMAITLQRSLLPSELPEQSAVEVAFRYLPAQAGVGGDWFDVIPLPGARVALVVGDVVGHGLHAAATMGRLRTAVQNFSALDLSPEELLAHLDELVTRIDQEHSSEGDGVAITGATCLYAIYNPASGQATMGRAGHPGPALVHPDGTVAFPDVPVSPPLGLGAGLPVETAELQLPADSRLVLYTDGLIESRDRDFDAGLGLLRDVLAHRDQSPEETCQAVISALLPARPGDDIALLVARTRTFAADQVADWDVPSDTTAVAPVRAACVRRLEAWGLGHLTFTTELIVSELVTNAIRYGAAPIGLRLLHDVNSLICEVSDASSTSPHLRRAATTDEGGRGLYLVAQLAQRWGTRYTARGKVIWTEQYLQESAAEPGAETEESLLEQWDDDAAL